MSGTVPVRPDVTVRWYEPWPGTSAPAGPTLLWLHGGGFFRGGLDQPEAHDVLGTRLDRQRSHLARVDVGRGHEPDRAHVRHRHVDVERGRGLEVTPQDRE